MKEKMMVLNCAGSVNDEYDSGQTAVKISRHMSAPVLSARVRGARERERESEKAVDAGVVVV